MRPDLVKFTETLYHLSKVGSKNSEVTGLITDLLIKVEPDFPCFLVFFVQLD